MKKIKIAVASKNAHKVKELNEMLGRDTLELVSLSDLGFDGEIEENGSTFEENSLIKARFVCEKYGIPSLADDSGLCVDALFGEPGIYSARYASTDGHNATDRENVDKLLEKLAGVEREKRTARFMCVISIVLPSGVEAAATGKCEGYITEEIHGDGGFGYDPVFFSTSLGKTFGEASESEKNSVSHRASAVEEVKKLLPTLFPEENQN